MLADDPPQEPGEITQLASAADVLERFRPKVVSFHFGLPDIDLPNNPFPTIPGYARGTSSALGLFCVTICTVAVMPEVRVVKIGGQSIMDRGRSALFPILDEIICGAADSGTRHALIGMAHRGRLNVLNSILGKTEAQIFTEFEGSYDLNELQGDGESLVLSVTPAFGAKVVLPNLAALQARHPSLRLRP